MRVLIDVPAFFVRQLWQRPPGSRPSSPCSSALAAFPVFLYLITGT